MGVSLMTLGVPGVMAAASPGWVPTDDSNLIYLHDLDTALDGPGGSTPTDGGKVKYVPDGATAGTYTLAEAAANKGGTYRANAVNGHAAVEFVTASQDRLDFAVNLTTEAITLFYVVARTAETNSTVLQILNKHSINIRNAGGFVSGFWGAAVATTLTVNDTFDILTIVINAANDIDFRQNGVQQTITTGVSYGNNAKSVYGAGSAGSFWASYKLAYAFALAGAADLATIATAENFLADRFGLTLSF